MLASNGINATELSNCLIPDIPVCTLRAGLSYGSYGSRSQNYLRPHGWQSCLRGPSAPRKSEFSVPWQCHVRTRIRQLILDRDQFAPFPIPGIQTNSDYFTLFHEDFWCLSNAFLWTIVNPMGAMLSTLHRSHEKGLVSAMTATRDESDTQRSILYQKHKDHKELLNAGVRSMPKLSEVQCWAQLAQWHASLGGPVDGL